MIICAMTFSVDGSVRWVIRQGLTGHAVKVKDVHYKTHLPNLLSTLVNLGRISKENFIEHLGDERHTISLGYYRA